MKSKAELIAYLRAKAVLLALVLEPPLRHTNDSIQRTDHYALEAAHMDFENARGEWKYGQGLASAHGR